MPAVSTKSNCETVVFPSAAWPGKHPRDAPGKKKQENNKNRDTRKQDPGSGAGRPGSASGRSGEEKARKQQKQEHPKTGSGRRREFAGDGSLQAMGVCRGRPFITSKSAFGLPNGSLQATGVAGEDRLLPADRPAASQTGACRRWEFAGEDRLLPADRPSASQTGACRRQEFAGDGCLQGKARRKHLKNNVFTT